MRAYDVVFEDFPLVFPRQQQYEVSAYVLHSLQNSAYSSVLFAPLHHTLH
jgi:hypothetical protein